MTLNVNFTKAKNAPQQKPGKYFDWNWNAERQAKDGDLSGVDSPSLERHKDFNGGTRNTDGAERQYDYDEVVRLYRTGLSGKSIAKQLGANPATIYRILKLRGVTRSYNGGRNQHNV